MNRYLRRLALVLSMLLLAACDCGHSVTAGTVVKKSHAAAWVQFVQTCVSYDPKGWCNAYTFIPIEWPETWSLKLRDDNQIKPADQRDTSWVDVPETEYERYEVGERYP